LKQKNYEDTKGKKIEVNESKFINVNEVVMDNDVRSDRSCVA